MSTSVHFGSPIDTTRDWVERHRTNSEIKPSLLIRYATDTNYFQNSDKAVMNLALPGQRVPNPMTWSVTEAADQLVQSATLNCLNCCLVSKRTTTLTSTIPFQTHGSVITSQWTMSEKGGDFGGLYKYDGNFPIGHFHPLGTPFFPYGSLNYEEGDVRFRLFDNTTFTVASSAGFPNAAIPQDDDNDVPDIGHYTSASNGAGAYFVMVDQEIIRVCNLSGNTFEIPPGGRGIGGTPIQTHTSGATVTLLNYGPYTGEWVGMGYMNVDDYNPETSLMRVGTCLVSYEGYGNISGPMSHTVDHGRNYVFTGYWFVTGVQPALNSDGLPTIQIDLKSGAHMIDNQTVNPTLLARMGSAMAGWTNGIWGNADYKRVVPSQWINFKSWDPAQQNAYPLTVSTEWAQNKAYLEHYQSTDRGHKCEICIQDVNKWLKGMGINQPYGTATVSPQHFDDENRVVGMHIYKESIRVSNEAAGPLKTYIALMAVIAMSSWDHPALETELAQMFTKIPNRLASALTNIHTGLCFNGQLSMRVEDPIRNATKDWFNPGYVDDFIVSQRDELLCPFTSTYDQVPFTQPMQDLADVNAASLWFTREGYPVFVPQFFSFRPRNFGDGRSGYRTFQAFQAQDDSQRIEAPSSEWHMSYGGCISDYSSSVDASQVFTVANVTGTLPYDGSTITVYGGGTGISQASGSVGKRIMYSPLGGNRDGLAMTGGVTRVTTMGLDNVILGLNWDTKAAKWGVAQQKVDAGGATVEAGTQYVLNGMPPLYEGQVEIGLSNGTASNGHSYHENARHLPSRVKDVQQTLSFFQIHRYGVFIYKGKAQYGVTEDGKWGEETDAAMKALQLYLNAHPGATGGITVRTDGQYGQTVFRAINNFLLNNANYIKNDVFSYAVTMSPWDEYVAAITGVPVKLNGQTLDLGQYAINDTGTQSAVRDWANRSFSRPLVNIANRLVDNSINKATARSISCSMADPRVQPGDTIWLNIPGYLGTQTSPPYTNGMYVMQVGRSMDLVQGNYTATLSGCRYAADHNGDYQSGAIGGAYDFNTRAGDI